MDKLTGLTKNLSDIMRILHTGIFPMRTILERLGLSKGQISIIFYLHMINESTVSEAAEKIEISRPNMTPLVDSLVMKNLITRTQDKKDRRKTIISLTPQGRSIMKDLNNMSLETAGEILSKLSEEEKRNLEESSEVMLSILKKHTPEDVCLKI